MDKQQFLVVMREYLGGKRPEANAAALTLGSSLWETGFVDSVSMVELILFVEQLLGADVTLDTGDVRSFGSIQAIYDNHVKPRVAAV